MLAWIRFVRVNCLVLLLLRLAQSKHLWTGGWGKLWNLAVCTWLAKCVIIYRCSVKTWLFKRRGDKVEYLKVFFRWPILAFTRVHSTPCNTRLTELHLKSKNVGRLRKCSSGKTMLRIFLRWHFHVKKKKKKTWTETLLRVTEFWNKHNCWIKRWGFVVMIMTIMFNPVIVEWILLY